MVKIKSFNILLLVSILILIFITIGYFSIRKNEKAVISDAIDAIPLDAAFIFETDNISSLKKVIEKNNVTNKLLIISQLSELKYQINILDTIMNNSSTLNSLLKKNKIIISAHSPKYNELDFLIALKIYPKKKQKLLVDEIIKHSNSDSLKSILYSDIKIYSFKTNRKIEYYYCFADNIFLVSKSLSEIKSAIRQKQSNNPISLDLGFKETSQLSENNSHLYLNMNNLSDYLKNFLSSSYNRKTENIKNLANWSAFDILINENIISLVGKTFCASSANKYLDMFNNSEPQRIDFLDIIPYKTAEFLFLATDDIAKFYSKYEKYISSKNLLTNYRNQSNDFLQKNHFNIQPEILPLLDNSILFVNVNFNNSINSYSNFVILKIKNINDFKQLIIKLYNTDTLKYTEKNLDNSKKIRIFNFSDKNFLKILVGELADFTELNYFTYYKNYIIFGESNDEVRKYAETIYRKKTLEYNSDYKKFEKSLTSKTNVFYYTNNNFSASTQINLLKSDYQKIYNKNLNLFKNFQFVTVQFAFEKDNIFSTNINLSYNNKLSNNGLTTWETELNNNVYTKPFFFINHYTFDKEIFVSDNKNIVYLIDKQGKIIWKKKINEPIVGDIFMTDVFSNKKYQITFCTSNYILTLDRNGEPVTEKTIKLKDSTIVGLTIVDYDNNRDYRYFVPCSNNQVYLYDNDLKPVTAWNIPKTSSPIVSKINYFVDNGKDYIVFADKNKIHILNRKGEERISVSTNFSLPNTTDFYFQEKTGDTKASFITTDASGNIITIFMNGTISSKKLITVSANHNFVCSDINGDRKLDFILTDGKSIFVFDNSGKDIFSYTFDGNIYNKPIVLKFSSKNIKIGVTIKNKSQVYLFNIDGTIVENFPIQGNSLFSVGFLSSKDNFNLVVGNNNYLYNYIVL